MAKEKLTRDKPYMNEGTIGHVNHGEPILTAGMTQCFSKAVVKHDTNEIQIDQITQGLHIDQLREQHITISINSSEQASKAISQTPYPTITPYLDECHVAELGNNVPFLH